MAATKASMLKSGRSAAHSRKGCTFDGCSCHQTRDQRRKGKRPQKRKEAVQWKRENGLA